ncbi:MAG TPA: hypothetical protein P5525_21355, partial [Candidatus Paceibacterota bacterium]|nr:hypothetical protein [Candidatus Paceibacterota bacterium]
MHLSREGGPIPLFSIAFSLQSALSHRRTANENENEHGHGAAAVSNTQRRGGSGPGILEGQASISAFYLVVIVPVV